MLTLSKTYVNKAKKLYFFPPPTILQIGEGKYFTNFAFLADFFA